MSAPALQGDGAALVPPPEQPPARQRPADVPVHVAMAAVMADVRALGKNDRNAHFGYQFRGVDATVNALGPAMRTHGVVLLPQVEHIEYRDVQIGPPNKRRDAHEVKVRVRYTFVGPKGDRLDVVTCGEAIDEADKGTAKATSVALRIALLQTFALPTDDPDPDASDVQRGERGNDRPTGEREQAGRPSERGLTLAAASLAKRLLAGDRAAVKAMWDEVKDSPAREVDVSGLLDDTLREAFGIGPRQPVTVLALRGLVAANLAAQQQPEQPAEQPAADPGEIM